MKQFRKFFKTPIEKNGDLERQAILANRVRPFMLRRTKNQVASELPAKTEILRITRTSGCANETDFKVWKLILSLMLWRKSSGGHCEARLYG